MRMIKTFCLKRKGSVLSLVVLVAVLLVIVGLGLNWLGMNGRMLAVRSASDVAARSAADTAIDSAIDQLNEKLRTKTWDGILPSVSNQGLLGSDATFDYSVGINSGLYTIQGTGRAGNGVRTVNCTLRLYSPFDFAVFARDSIELKNGTVVDWYNNDADDWPLQVGTSSTNDDVVILKNGTTINGDVVVGMGGNPDDIINDSGANITGDTYAMSYEPELPSIAVPSSLDILASSGDISSTMTVSSYGKYDQIDLGNSEVLTIDEPVELYITGDIDLGNSAEICIGGPSDTDNDASLTIYLAGNVNGSNSSGFNNLTTDAQKLTIYCLDSCEDIVFKNSSDFYGAIYAPNASVELKNSADVYGSIIADTFLLKNSATVHYDASLRDRTVNDEAVRFVVHRWSE